MLRLIRKHYWISQDCLTFINPRKLIRVMNPDKASSPPVNLPALEQELLPLERLQITNTLPAETRRECHLLFEELLRQVILDQNHKL